MVEKINNSFSIETKLNRQVHHSGRDNDEKQEMRMDDWKFNFHDDYENKGSKIHGIRKNSKTIKCDPNMYCRCFASISNVGMKPNSGIYNIKIKINTIENDSYGNIIGITSQKYDNSRKKANDDKDYLWYNQSNNYIG